MKISSIHQQINIIAGSLLLMLILITGCSKSTKTTPANPYGGDKGQVTFWSSNPNSSFYPITVTVNGEIVGTIGGMLNGTPDCDGAVSNVVKFVNEPGTYNFTCEAAGNAGNWTGAITVTNAGCYIARLQ